MRRLTKFFGIIAIGALIAIALAGCKDDSGPSPKTLIITDVSLIPNSGSGSAEIGIFLLGTTLQQALARTGIVAGATDSEMEYVSATDSSIVKLYLPSSGSRWTGSGTYDVYVAQSNPTAYYVLQNVEFVSSETSVSAK
ncbi:MAG: hypothetical protein LBU19_04940, partial [Treponema sp.]|nr:hypothetical protein [Treponema sp.]